jgi:hypothetical protein
MSGYPLDYTVKATPKFLADLLVGTLAFGCFGDAFLVLGGNCG